MGKYNSTLTRVALVFESICHQAEWLKRLLTLPTNGHKSFRLPDTMSLNDAEVHFADGKTRKEHALPAPVGLLSYLIRNLKILGPNRTNPETNNKRRLLVEGDASTIREALGLLQNSGNPQTNSWHLLEGPTSPDVYIETNDLIVVIEGKRTERGPTTKTTFMEVRHQMLRHLDCAYEIRGRKSLIGFFIVEAYTIDNPQLPSEWELHCENTIELAALHASLPHRNEEECEAIARAFAGATTWLAVAREFGLPDPCQQTTVDKPIGN